LNALPQFITEIDGLDIHFIHVRSKHENALPLIVTHGWPGSKGLTRDDVLDNITITWLEHSAFGRSSLLGDFGESRVFQCERRRHPGCRERLPGRTLSRPTELGGAGVSQTHPLQQARQGRTLRCLGAAETLLRRGPHRIQIAPKCELKTSACAPCAHRSA
jgi:hypothetical protein